MEKQTRPLRISAGQRDNTVYIIEHATGENAGETSTEKVRRLILNEVTALGKHAS